MDSDKNEKNSSAMQSGTQPISYTVLFLYYKTTKL